MHHLEAFFFQGRTRLANSEIWGCACSGPNFAAALLRSARLGGNTAMLLRAVLSAQANRVSAALGTRSGIEMRSGRAAAERIGAQIVLGGCPS